MKSRVTNSSAFRVLYVGVEDVSYPRNQRVRRFLSELGAEISIIPSPVHEGRVRRAASLARDFFKHTRGYDYVILAEFSNSLFWYSWLIAKINRAPHIVDFFIGKYETLVEDAERYPAHSPAAKLLRLIDLLTLKSADFVFTDTELRARNFSRLTRTRAQFLNLPVGSPFATGEAPKLEVESGEVSVLYYGYYSKLHAVPRIARALIAAADVAEFTVTMVGDGDSRSETEALTRAAGADNFTFLDNLPAAELVKHIEMSRIVFGVFGTSAKARSVIPNKVWQGLYAGKVVITAESKALEEIAPLVGDQLVQVPIDDALALDRAVSSVIRRITMRDHEGYPSSASVLESHVRARFSEVFAEVLGVTPAQDGGTTPTANTPR